MRKKRISLNTRLTVITMAVFLLLALLVTVSGLFIFQKILKSNVRTSTDFNLQLISDNIRQQLTAADTFSRWCAASGSVVEYFSGTDSGGKLAGRLQEDLCDEYNSSPASPNIRRVILFDRQGVLSPVQLSHGPELGQASISETVSSSGEIQSFIKSGEDFSITYMTTPFPDDTEDYVLALMRPIRISTKGPAVGYIYMELFPSIITSFLEEYTIPEDTTVYLTMNGKSYRVNQADITEQEIPFPQNSNCISREIGFSDWTLTQDISHTLLTNQWQIYLYFLLLIVAILITFGILFSIYLNSTLSRPIQKLRYRIGQISQGDFSCDPDIEWNHELGDIGRGINRMSSEMEQMIERKIAADHAKTDLEYQILLNQVNPHFMYNTLNSIKWMAAIQGATGIAEMTTALARLLKSVSKRTTKQIPLRDELSLLDDYFKILQYRYGGTLTLNYEIKDDRLYDALVPKFTLQPLVENAIFHGLEPKHQAGTIWVQSCFLTDKTFCIEVVDDGAGMTQEQIDAAMSHHEQASSGLFRGVGIYNVRERIRFEFGSEYELKIESKEGEYTKIILSLPYIINVPIPD